MDCTPPSYWFPVVLALGLHAMYPNPVARLTGVVIAQVFVWATVSLRFHGCCRTVLVHAFGPSSWEGRGRQISVSSRPAWFTEGILEQPGQLNREALYRKKEKSNKRRFHRRCLHYLAVYLVLLVQYLSPCCDFMLSLLQKEVIKIQWLKFTSGKNKREKLSQLVFKHFYRKGHGPVWDNQSSLSAV